jgi:hypothetical protein
MRRGPFHTSRIFQRVLTALLVIVIVGCLAPVLTLVFQPRTRELLEMSTWFDPRFFQYNIVLLATAQVIVPAITFLYVSKMKGEKLRRLRRDVPEAVWAREESEIIGQLDRHFRFENYLGSIALVLILITLGASILLLLKPVAPGSPPGSGGVDYMKGGNFLLLGPVMEYGSNVGVYYHRVIVSLTAFQFGFLGAYVYFIGHVVRSYFTLDLTPNTYVESAVRMATAAVLALVVSFALPLETPCAPDARAVDCLTHPLPLVAFFLGHFPERGFVLLRRLAMKFVESQDPTYSSTPLSALSGMSYAHEIRLLREGFDSLENLSHADALDLAVRTGFSYRQVSQWVGEAWLRLHMGEEYGAFAAKTGIVSRDDLWAFVQEWEKEERKGRPADHLSVGGTAPWALKIDAVCALLAQYEPHGVGTALGDGSVVATREPAHAR